MLFRSGANLSFQQLITKRIYNYIYDVEIRGFPESLDLQSFSSSHLQCTRKKKRCHFKTREFSPVRAARQNIEVRNWHEKMASGVAAGNAAVTANLRIIHF